MHRTLKLIAAAAGGLLASAAHAEDFTVSFSPLEIRRHYPDLAKQIGVAGRVVLSCTPERGRAAQCAVGSESPAGFGFGEAALRVSRSFRVGGEPPANITIPITFVPPAAADPAQPPPGSQSLALVATWIEVMGSPEVLDDMRPPPPFEELDRVSPEVRAAAEAARADWRDVIVASASRVMARRLDRSVKPAGLQMTEDFLRSPAAAELAALRRNGRWPRKEVERWMLARPELQATFGVVAGVLTRMSIEDRAGRAALVREIELGFRERVCARVDCEVAAHQAPPPPL